MEPRILGRTGLSVSVVGLGAGTFGAFGDATEKECLALAHCAFDGGINLIDTADFYGFGESETIVGKAIAGRRDRLIVATKAGMAVSDEPNERGGSRRWLTAAVERSLLRLKTDYIDLYQLHQPDPLTAIEETLETLNDLLHAGKIRYFGLSNFSAMQLTDAVWTARARGLLLPHTHQGEYSILERRCEAELLPVCEGSGQGFLAYSPLAGGWLSGRYRRGAQKHQSARQRFRPAHFDVEAPENQARLDAVERLAALAAKADLSLAQLALGFSLAHPGVTCALIGASKLEQVRDHLAGESVRLSDEILDGIDAIVQPGHSLGGKPPATPALLDWTLRRRRAGPIQSGPASGDAIRKQFEAADPKAKGAP